MFDIGWSELVVIAVVALIAIGPKELPAVLRTVGAYMGKIRRMASEFQGQFQEAMREAEMADLKKSVDEMTDVAKGFSDFDPLASVKKEVDTFTADPLGTTPPATASPEPVSSDATILDTSTTVTPEAPQSQPETKTDKPTDLTPDTKSGATPGSGA